MTEIQERERKRERERERERATKQQQQQLLHYEITANYSLATSCLKFPGVSLKPKVHAAFQRCLDEQINLTLTRP